MASIEMVQYFILKFNLENTLLRRVCARVCVYIIRLKALSSYTELLLWVFIKFRPRDLCSCPCVLCLLGARGGTSFQEGDNGTSKLQAQTDNSSC